MQSKQAETRTPSANGQTARPIVEVQDLKVHFPISEGIVFARRVGAVRAVDGVSFTVNVGETIGLVGESGSGKTTLGRALLQLIRTTSGRVLFEGEDLTTLSPKEMRRRRRKMGIVFQDPYGSLNPRMTAGEIVGEPLAVHRLAKDGRDYRERVGDLLERVGLSRGMTERFPHEFSGGQRQRLGVARAIAATPSFIVLDEPVSALDVSIQAQIINLLKDLQTEFKLSYLFIAHDLSVVRHISDRIAVMYLGKIVELADRTDIYENPKHPYTQALLSAVPIPDPVIERKRERVVLKGETPSPRRPPEGCVFNTRCPIAVDECRQEIPALRELAPGHRVACIRV